MSEELIDYFNKDFTDRWTEVVVTTAGSQILFTRFFVFAIHDSERQDYNLLCLQTVQ